MKSGVQTEYIAAPDLFNTLFEQDAMGMAIRAIDPRDSRWMRVNQKFCDMLGYTREELLQLTSVDISLPEEKNLAVDYNEQLLSCELNSYSREKRYLRKDGTVLWTNIWLSAVLDRDGNPTQIISVVQDISTLKAAERSSREREESYEKLIRAVNQTSEMIVLFDPEDRIVFANRAWRELNAMVEWTTKPGITFEQHIRALTDGGFVPEAIGHEETWIAERLESHRNPSGPFEVSRQDNTWILINEQVLEDGSIILIINDITRQKMVEEALVEAHDKLEERVEERTSELRGSEQRFKDYAAIGSDWYWETDPDGRFKYISDSFYEAAQIPPKDIIGKPRLEWVNEEEMATDPEKWRRHFDDLDARRSFSNLEYAVSYADGTVHHISVNGRPVFDKEGVFQGYRGADTNITERKQAEIKLLNAMEAAEAANKAKSEFLSSMRHELRTPMNAILGFGQMLKIDSNEPLSDSQNSHVDHILKGGNHLMTLIDDVLELSKIEAGKLSVNFESIRVQGIIDESLNLIQASAQQGGIDILDQIPKGELPILWTDGTRLTQALVNLLSNAVKYNRKNGKVILSCEETSERMLRFSVSDTGMGIPEEKQSDLFKSFERLGREAGVIEGSGIGLSITKRLIELLGGEIGYQSVVGKGSTFWIDIPRSHELKLNKEMITTSIKTHPIAKPKVNDDATRTILYIEDNADNMQLMRCIITQLNNTELVPADNADLGLDLATSKIPDLILMDLNLPGMNGFEALKQLQNTTQTQDIPVIAITAAAMPKDIDKGLRAGFKDYITKPFKVGTCIRLIEEVLGSIENLN